MECGVDYKLSAIDLRIPVVIGVVGHRDLREGDLAVLEEKVERIFEEIRGMYSHSPITVVSALAQGADCLVAKVAIKLAEQKNFDIQLAVVLPMARDLYKADFPTRESREEFNELISKAQSVITLPLEKGNTLQNISDPGERRDQQYVAVGNYLVRHCHILIALWDGRHHMDKLGGTSHVIRLKRDGGLDPYFKNDRSILQHDRSGIIYHVVTPRKSNAEPVYVPYDIRDETDENNKKHILEIYDKIDKFNEDIEQDRRCRQDEMLGKEDMIPAAYQPELTAACRASLEQYMVADTLAIKFQKRRFGSLKLLAVLTALGALSFGLYIHQGAVFLFSYLLIILAGVVSYTVVSKYQYGSKHLDYRALAEGMRVQLYWQLAGVDKCVADYYLLTQKSELDWICSAIRSWVNMGGRQCDAAVPVMNERQQKDVLQLVKTQWLENQKRYFLKRATEDKNKEKFYKRLSNCLIIGGLGLATVVALVEAAAHFNVITLYSEAERHAFIHTWLMFPMGGLPALGAIIRGYLEKILLSAQAKQYTHMHAVFNQADEHMEHLISKGDLVRAGKLISELGQHALGENGDWVLLHRDRPMEMPHGAG